jgi:Flp pilus assembly protein TadD
MQAKKRNVRKEVSAYGAEPWVNATQSGKPQRRAPSLARKLSLKPRWLAAAALFIPLIARADPAPPFDATAPPTSDASHGPALSGALSPGAKAAAQAGVEALAKNKFTDAETAFLKLLKLAPDNPNALVNLGLVEFRLGRAEESQKYLHRAIRVQPDAAFAWMMLGVNYMNAGDTEGATAALAQAVYLGPKSPQAHNYYAVALAKRGWYDAAEDELRKVITLAPTFAEAHFNLALIYFQQNPPAVELARRHYQKALELGAQPDPEFEAKLKAAPEQSVQ